MGTDFNGVEAAVVVVAVVFALGDGALDGGIRSHVVHFGSPFVERRDLKS